jgi:predicted regulator of Ras-like GTPase activity (Roadblock/LC7/MglB family)
MAGWAPYVALVMKGAGVKAAAIVGHDGATWGEQGCKISVEEAKALAAGLKDISKFQAGGIVVDKVKYMYLNNPAQGQAIGRKGPTTVMLASSGKATVVVLTKDGANPGNVTSHTFVADDLKKKNF